MSQRLTQIQAQKTEQQLRLSQQQLQLVRLLEMPIAGGCAGGAGQRERFCR